MGLMYDSVTWENVWHFPAVAGYLDGTRYAWPAKAWETLVRTPSLSISVEGNPEAGAFDDEPGDAGAARIAAACKVRYDRNDWSVVYVNESGLGGITEALRQQHLGWTDAEHWPGQGVYLWAAWPRTPFGEKVPWAPVVPIAVQREWLAGYDVSETVGDFPKLPALVAPPTPPAPAPVPPKPAEKVYVVQDGDSLWSIAQRELGKGTLWAELYAANHNAIGDNPNVIHPGLRLVIP